MSNPQRIGIIGGSAAGPKAASLLAPHGWTRVQTMEGEIMA
jgi:hypothetical protein